jgi:hypothetical protein
MMEDDPSPRSSRDTRQAFTVALVKPGRGPWAYWGRRCAGSARGRDVGERGAPKMEVTSEEKTMQAPPWRRVLG